MPKSNESDYKSYMLPNKYLRNAKAEIRETTLKQIAQAQVHIAHYKHLKESAKTKEDMGKYGLQIDKLEMGLAFNVGFMEWIDAQ